jgi:hypothetical protein
MLRTLVTVQEKSKLMNHTTYTSQALFWSSTSGSLLLFFSSYGRAIAEAVNCQPLTADDRVRSRIIPCGIYGGKSGTRTGFSPSSLVFPC